MLFGLILMGHNYSWSWDFFAESCCISKIFFCIRRERQNGANLSGTGQHFNPINLYTNIASQIELVWLELIKVLVKPSVHCAAAAAAAALDIIIVWFCLFSMIGLEQMDMNDTLQIIFFYKC